MLCLNANARASVRECTPSLARMLFMWPRSVLTLTLSPVAARAVETPLVRTRSTSSSRRVSLAKGVNADALPVESLSDAQTPPRRKLACPFLDLLQRG